MKKFLLPMAVALLTLSSCQDEPKQPQNTLQYKVEMPTCIIPLNATDDSQVILTEQPTYTYTLYTGDNKWTLGAAGINIPQLPTVKFTTPKLNPGVDPTTGGYNFVFNINNEFTADGGSIISRFIGTFVQNYYYYTGEQVIGLNPKPLGHALMTLAFNVDNKYSVRAFPKTAYYGGSLVTKYKDKNGADKTYTTTTPVCGVNVNLGAKTATITMHNIRFAEEMPMTLEIIQLTNLPLSGDREDGYKIEAKNIVPVVGIGQNATPFPNFTFDEIEMHPTNSQMTTCEIEFKVAGKYEGTFLGSIAR
ncbi:MAG: hypothetical protein NC217_01240 [Muribaculaceae bacterium]|nr:hypothetical protein [Muribaculaceae bacterium]